MGKGNIQFFTGLIGRYQENTWNEGKKHQDQDEGECAIELDTVRRLFFKANNNFCARGLFFSSSLIINSIGAVDREAGKKSRKLTSLQVQSIKKKITGHVELKTK